ncbi:MAG: hypothetical protein B6244_13855 [Candidatus Cloacimonetes bacterium 4572_55]|nr:MAG: hypothetical protein B6244_13855 [Candidatus Cloacimonetes bacterium 4572_55]
MKQVRLLAKLTILWVLLAIVGWNCGGEEDGPLAPSTIESGTGQLETPDGYIRTYQFNVSVGEPVDGFSMSIDSNQRLVLSAAYGLVKNDGSIAPDPSSLPKGQYDSAVYNPAVGDQLYLFVDHNESRYFARFRVTNVKIGDNENNNPSYARIQFDWDFNINSGSREF